MTEFLWGLHPPGKDRAGRSHLPTTKVSRAVSLVYPFPLEASMLLAPRRPLFARVLVRIGALWPERREASLADRRYLDSMSGERLERDLGLTRTHERIYRPF